MNELIQKARELCGKEGTEFWYVEDGRWNCGKTILMQLCDALEAAQKEIEDLKESVQYMNKVSDALTARAEKAETENRWIPVSERLPDPETEVIILAKTKIGNEVITTAMYEDGKMPTGDSVWNWYDLDFDYDEEKDEYLIPEGWWEYRHYNPDDVYNNAVDDTVTHWRPIPELPKEATK